MNGDECHFKELLLIGDKGILSIQQRSHSGALNREAIFEPAEK
jgi:hypothetical protein